MSYKFCPQPFNTINIHNNGDVIPCLCGDWHTVSAIGNLCDNNLQHIINSNRSIEFRDSIIDQSFKFCKPTCANYWNLKTVNDFNGINYKLPTTILLSIDRNCNLKCESCRTNNIFSTDINETANIILSNLIETYKDYTEPVRIQCDGSGDIFASATYKQFFSNTELPKCFEFVITTNGNLITKNLDWFSRISQQIIEVEVSFDAATPDTYKQVRGGNFNLVIQGVKDLINLGIPVRSQFVVQQKNYKEILQYKDLAKQLGINHVGYQCISRWWHMSNNWWDQNKLENNCNVDYDFLIPALAEIQQEEPYCGLSGALKGLIEKGGLTA